MIEPEAAVVDALRRFNRTHTRRVGALDESFLGSGRALGPNRLLFEIGTGTNSVGDLRRRLALDSGYLSRLLRELEDARLVEVQPAAADGRRRVVTLTARGRAAWEELDARSDELASRLVEPLTARQRATLADALATADRLLRAATISYEVVDPHGPQAQSSMRRYFAELDARFAGGFAARDANAALAEGADAFTAPTGAFVVAVDDESADRDAVACGALARIDENTAEIKRMWVDPRWRGAGLGARMLARLEAVAGEAGYRRVVLDTNGSLTEAIAMYSRHGYEPIVRYNDNPYAEHWFARELTA